MLLPMLSLGTAVCVLLLLARGKQVARMYDADLGCAALGALLAAPLLHGLPTPSAVAALGFLPILAATLIGSRRHLVSLVYAALLVGSVASGDSYRLHYARFYIEDRPPLYEQWTATAGITIFDRQSGLPRLGNGRALPPRITSGSSLLDQDGSAGTPILPYQGGRPYPDYLSYDVVSAAYPITSPARAGTIGGGGRDILKAVQGARRRWRSSSWTPTPRMPYR